MREGSSALVHRADYAAPAFWIRAAELTFDLDPVKTIVASRLSVQRNPDAAPNQPLKLHGEGLQLLRVMSGGESLAFRHEDGLLVIDQPPASDEFVLEIRNTCAPEKNTELRGLYTSGGGFFTQCEAEGFRRITYFLDRPDVMAVFSVTLRADKALYPVLLSNGNLAGEGLLDNGRHWARWEDPFPKPSYLFALVAAKLVAREQRVRSRSGREHLLQVYVRKGDLDKTEHAMNSLVASVVWDEVRFGLPLDLERFMIVAVEDFNMGAMENKGLNIFNTKYVLASAATATDTDFAGIESVVAHEYFHNWTGNRVTCRDWFQLSLKEGLTVFRDQEFSQDMAAEASARAVKRIEDVYTLRTRQFPEDAGPMAHPVRPDQYAAIDNFYTATVYEKGAELVRMMQALVGRDGFAQGMALYFKRHDGQAVTCDDFAQAIADANPGSALSTRLQTFKRWYAQAGTPRVMARGRYDGAAQTYTLSLSQLSGATPGQPDKLPLVIPVRVGLLSAQGQGLASRLLPKSQNSAQNSAPDSAQDSEQGSSAASPALEHLLVLESAQQDFVFSGVTQAPVPSLLRGFSAPVVLDDGLLEADRLVLLAHDSDAFNRWEAGQRVLLSTLLDALAQGREPQLSPELLAALRSVLQHPVLAPALKALILTLPSEGYVTEQLASVNPQQVHAARESLRRQLALALQPEWVAAFNAHQVTAGYEPNNEQSGQRALAGLALHMLCLAAHEQADPVWPGRAYQRVKTAGNMTDRFNALSALVFSQAELATPALAHFHAQFKHEALVIDKWFTLQAQAPSPKSDGGNATGPGTLGRVKALMQHPDFSLKNPNRARSLIFALCSNNPAAFHRADAAGYVFWADRVVELDALNPSLGARLARALDHWRRLAEPLRSAAHEALTRVAARSELSSDTREIISKSLTD